MRSRTHALKHRHLRIQAHAHSQRTCTNARNIKKKCTLLRDCVCARVCACVSVLREAHTNTAPGLITLLRLPSMPAAFWMAHGPHAHRVGSCSPAAAVQQSAAAMHAIAIRPCVPYTRQYTAW